MLHGISKDYFFKHIIIIVLKNYSGWQFGLVLQRVWTYDKHQTKSITERNGQMMVLSDWYQELLDSIMF